MTWLKQISGQRFEDALALAPHTLQADAAMLQAVKGGLGDRLYALVSLTIAGCIGCGQYVEVLRGPLEPNTASQMAEDWREAPLSDVEQAVMAYVEKGTLNESDMRRDDVQALRDVGLSDGDILSIAATVAYQNYAIRAAAALGVDPR